MTKAQKADLLLCAAKHWQNCDTAADSDGNLHDIVMAMLDAMPSGCGLYTVCASLALSEAAGLGFDLESVEP